METEYKYNATDDSLDAFIKCFTSRIGDGSGDAEENFLSCLKLVACCKSGGQFLDIGSGLGRIIGIILPYAAHVVGLEPDAERFHACHVGFAHVQNVEMHDTVSSVYRRENPGKNSMSLHYPWCCNIYRHSKRKPYLMM